MYICDTTVKEWNRCEDCQTPVIYQGHPTAVKIIICLEK